MTLIEQLQEWERRMTPHELNHAFAIAKAAGWQPGDLPPLFVWAAIYREVAPEKQPDPGPQVASQPALTKPSVWQRIRSYVAEL